MSRCGIRNYSNDCYLNSTLQSLAVSPFIREFISRYSIEDTKMIEIINKYNLGKFKAQDIKTKCKIILLEQSNIISIEESKILNHLSNHSFDIYIYIAFKEIIRKLNNSDGKIINNKSFMSITNELSQGSDFKHLFSGEQNDPHELMAYLLDKLHNAKTSSVNIDIPPNISDLDIYYQLYLKEFKTRYENDYSYFVKNLYYYILNCVECSKCKHKSYNVCPNDIICLSIPESQLDSKSSSNITLYDCFDEMFKTDKINYKCEICKNTDDNLIEKKILSKPKTLIIKLKRYYTINTIIGPRQVKIDNMIYYPDTINMQKYFCGELTQNYKLYSVINHTGTIDGGHYYSYVKNLKEDNKTFEDQWICCNDSQVYNISDEEAMTSHNAYILFYTL